MRRALAKVMPLVRATCVMCVLAGARVAHADAPAPDDVARIQELKKMGDALLIDAHPADALGFYDKALAIGSDAATRYNRGRALSALARYGEALAELERFEQEAPPELRARVPELEKFKVHLRSRLATVSIACNVEGATVSLRGEEVGTTPLAKAVILNAGAANLVVTKEGYFPYKRSLDLPGAGTSAVTATLMPRATTSLITITSRTIGASVRVDDGVVGMVPAELVLPAGSHRVEVSHAGHVTSLHSVTLLAGETRMFDVQLEPERSLASRWWFWTGVGAVAVAGAITVYALTTERTLDQGSIAPGSVRPLLQF